MIAPHQPTVLEQMHEELHEMCQPLTSLQCTLEIGKLIGTEEALREAVSSGLEETSRMFRAVARMRQNLMYEVGPGDRSIPDENHVVEGTTR